MKTDLVVGPCGARYLGRDLPCAIGWGGVRPAVTKGEGDGATPAGVWRLMRGWWRADRIARPATPLPMAPTPPWLGWCDDPADPAYNTPVALPYPASAERMRRADRLYDIVVTTDHNDPPVPGAGSAIFLHCWRGPRVPTAGCLAFRPDHLGWILAHWHPSSRVIVQNIFSQRQ